jgi:tRNA 2-thiouridine synthesizing protein A
MTERETVAVMDLRGTPCPLNWVKTKLRLEEMQPGERVEVVVDDGNPARNVPRSAAAEGHLIVATTPLADGVRVVIEKR